MLPISTSALTFTALHDASVALTRCRTVREVAAVVESVFAGASGDDGFDILWIDEQVCSLRLHPPTLQQPDERQRILLGDGDVVADDGISFIPFIVSGQLHGWITLGASVSTDQALVIWAGQAAATLAMLMALSQDSQHDRTGAHPSTSISEPVAPAAPDLRFSLSIQDIAEQITQTIEDITAAPRILVGQVDAERRKVRALSVHGLPPITHQSRTAGIDFDDWLKMIRRSIPLGAMTFHVGRHPLLSSFTSAVVVQIPGPHEVPEGVIVIDVGERNEPLTRNMVASIETIAHQAGAAISTARLYTEQQQTVDRLTAFNALSLAMSTSQLSIKDMLNMALAGAVGTTSGERGGAIVIWEGRPVETYYSPTSTLVDPTWVEQHIPVNEDYVEFDASALPVKLVDEGLQYVLIAPLRGTNLTMGALWIEYSLPSIDQAQREMIVLYGKMAGSVLENMYLDELVVNTRDRLASILRSAHEGMVLIDEQGRVVVTNRAFGQLVDVDEAAWQGRHMDEFCSDEEVLGMPLALRTEICERVRDVLHGRQDNATGDVTLDTRALTWQVLPVRGATSESVGALLVIHDVTAERRMESLRQDLSNMIVHDLRSPLTNIMVSIDLLLKQGTGSLTDSQTRILQIASVSCQQMLDLVNALLDIRRLQQQTVELQRQPIEIIDLAANVLERLEHVAQDKRVQIDNELGRLPYLMIDPDMIRRVLQNLIDNALKFSRPGEPIQLIGKVSDAVALPQGHPEGKWVVISVRDHGVGIPEEYHRVIFELFTQAPGGFGRGTGVGLAFCKLAVEAHGGRIWVDSMLGNGATFSFSLPLA